MNLVGELHPLWRKQQGLQTSETPDRQATKLEMPPFLLLLQNISSEDSAMGLHLSQIPPAPESDPKDWTNAQRRDRNAIAFETCRQSSDGVPTLTPR